MVLKALLSLCSLLRLLDLFGNVLFESQTVSKPATGTAPTWPYGIEVSDDVTLQGHPWNLQSRLQRLLISFREPSARCQTARSSPCRVADPC